MILLVLLLGLTPDADLCSRAVGSIAAERPTVALTAPVRMAVCLRVARAARTAGLDEHLAVAVAWRESRLTPGLCSGKGACGPMQAIPRWWCPGGAREGCDLTAAGTRALAHYTAAHPSVEKALCHYACGNVCNRHGVSYARSVLKMRDWLRVE